jgi:hypothetical protein
MKLQNIIHILIGIVCIGLLPKAQAVSPPPDGAYSGANTAEGGSGTLFSLTTGTNNTALGAQALFSVTTGSQNTATGAQALKSNTAGVNTADGFQALVRNTTGSNNTATGWRALFSNINGSFNTANGDSALYSNTGSNNTGIGAGALNSNTTASGNTALGTAALFSNTTGRSNTATGEEALASNTTGTGNTANGANALPGGPFSFGTDSNDTAVGVNTLVCERGCGDNNTAVGADSLPLASGGQNNIAIGYRAGVNLTGPGPANNNIEIGNAGGAGPTAPDQNTTRIGDVQTSAFVAGIYGTTTGSPTTLPVIVDSNGQLGTAVSSERFKKDIKPMDEFSESILALKPVNFHYKSDKTNTPQFGLIAEQVAAVNDALIVRDKNGKPYTVRYDAVNAMLLNEFLKEHRKVRELQATLAEQQKSFESKLAGEQKQIDALTAGLQKVSAQLEVSKPAPQTVLNSQ